MLPCPCCAQILCKRCPQPLDLHLSDRGHCSTAGKQHGHSWGQMIYRRGGNHAGEMSEKGLWSCAGLKFVMQNEEMEFGRRFFCVKDVEEDHEDTCFQQSQKKVGFPQGGSSQFVDYQQAQHLGSGENWNPSNPTPNLDTMLNPWPRWERRDSKGRHECFSFRLPDYLNNELQRIQVSPGSSCCRSEELTDCHP